jgi:hypothetical protein
MGEVSYLVEVVNPAVSSEPELIIAGSAAEANAIAAHRVTVMLDKLYGFTGDVPNATSWGQYLEMLRSIAADEGKPLPSVRIRSARD